MSKEIIEKEEFSFPKNKYSEDNSGNEVKYLWTTNPDLMLEYFNVREETYSSYLGLSGFSAKLDSIDIRSHVLLAIEGDDCVGGARLTLNDPVLETLLPMEEDDFALKQLFPELDLDNAMYGELSRLALLPEYRDGSCYREMIHRIVKKCFDLNLDYAFAVTRYAHAQRNRTVCATIPGFDYIIRDDIRVPDKPFYAGVKMYLSVMVRNWGGES